MSSNGNRAGARGALTERAQAVLIACAFALATLGPLAFRADTYTPEPRAAVAQLEQAADS